MQLSRLYAFLPLLSTIAVTALPINNSTLIARNLPCPSVKELYKMAMDLRNGRSVSNALFWSSDASQCYGTYARKHGLTVLRDLWRADLIDGWTKNNQDCFSNLSQAFAYATVGAVFVASCPVDTNEGASWSRHDNYLLHDELPILSSGQRRVTEITRLNFVRIVGAHGPQDCGDPAGIHVIWREGQHPLHYERLF